MRKTKNTIIIVMSVILIILALLVGGAMLVYSLLFGEVAEVHHEVSQYGQWESFDGYSGLKIFPKDIQENEIETYYYRSQDVIFSPECQIFLQAKYSDEAFEKEVQRLQNIRVVYDQEENLILYDAEHYIAPAYVCVDGWKGCYEYALVFREKNVIVYVYLQDMKEDKLEFNSLFLPNNYGEDADGYTIYGFGMGKDHLIFE